MIDERSMHIVITGHVDHGKSTLVGRLFYDTGCLPPDRMELLREASEAQGKKLEFAFVMDQLEEERERGITIDIAHTFFRTARRRYVIIDAPGHKEFLKNMITGSSQAEAALLLVDVTEGIREQTRRHCFILGLLGFKQIAVLVNKMDAVDYSEARFRAVKDEIGTVLGQLKITPTHVLPISAQRGENVATRSEQLAWYDGPTVLEALDSFSLVTAEDKDLRFPVQDVYDVDGQAVVAGRIEAGTIKKGQLVHVFPRKATGLVAEVRKFMQNDMPEAGAGHCIGLRFQGPPLRRGDVLVDKPTPTITDAVRATIFWLIDKDYELGIPLTFRCATQEVPGVIEKIYRRFDPATIEVIERDARRIKAAEIADVLIKLDKPVLVDAFAEVPEMGRFVLEHAGRQVAGGIVI
jgi:sulfate adenylyltransferase subunit 1 (EFTu-like GTPase family)